jgi:hypothetical protein
VTLKLATPPGVIGTCVAVHTPFVTPAFTPLIQSEYVESLMLPVAVTILYQS